jgi:hypothetical protein
MAVVVEAAADGTAAAGAAPHFLRQLAAEAEAATLSRLHPR